jgi:hypothetical protein
LLLREVLEGRRHDVVLIGKLLKVLGSEMKASFFGSSSSRVKEVELISESHTSQQFCDISIITKPSSHFPRLLKFANQYYIMVSVLKKFAEEQGKATAACPGVRTYSSCNI